MTSVLKHLEKAAIELTVTIPWEEVKAQYEKIIEKIVAEAEISGFRKGKAPRKLVEEKIDKKGVHEEALKTLLPKAYIAAINEHNLHPIVNPQIEIISREENKDWVIKFLTCEKPEVKLKNFKEEVKKLNNVSKIWVPGKDKKDAEKKDKEKEGEKINKIIDLLLRTTDLELPEILIETKLSQMLSQLLGEVKALGLSLDQYLLSANKTVESLRNEYKEKATLDLKLDFILENIADSEKIAVLEDDINKFLQSVKDEKIRDSLLKNRYELAFLLRRKKVLDFLQSL